jgi:flagellar motor switch protein FliN
MSNIDLPTAESLVGQIAEGRGLTATRSSDISALLETSESGIVVPVSGGNATGWIFLQETEGYLDARTAAAQVHEALEGSELKEGSPATPSSDQVAALRSNSDVYVFDLKGPDGKVTARTAVFISIAEQSTIDLSRFDRVSGVPLTMTVELGRTSLTIGEVLDMRPGQVIVLDSASGDPANLYANGKLVARGDITVVDQQFAIHIIEIIDTGAVR